MAGEPGEFYLAVSEDFIIAVDTRAEHWERRLTAAHNRYIRALESLVRVRALLKRAPVQVNIAQQQIVQNG